MQSNNKTCSMRPPVQPQPTPPAVATTSQKSLKKCDASEDEIDAVFKATLKNKAKKVAVGRVSVHEAQWSRDREMSEILGAIREAPSGESGRTKRRKVN